jgi:hypothetical protein
MEALASTTSQLFPYAPPGESWLARLVLPVFTVPADLRGTVPADLWGIVPADLWGIVPATAQGLF